MNDNKIVYKLTKGDEELIGSVDELEPHFDKNLKYGVANAYLRNGNYHGYKVERIGIYKKLYDIYDNNSIIFSGTLTEVSDYLYVTPTRIMQVADRGIKMFKQYTVKRNERKFVIC